jgi:hypothetical protein
MKRWLSCKVLFPQTVIWVLVLAVASLPLAPVSALSAETKDEAVVKEQQNLAVADDTKEQQAESVDSEAAEVTNPENESPEGMSNATKVGIGIGVAAIVGIALAAGGGGGGSDSKTIAFPTSANVVGSWSAVGTRSDGRESYTGTYTFSEGGRHTYDLYVNYVDTSENKVGNGRWELPAETFTLRVSNDTGSVYSGEFTNEFFNRISLTTTDGRWHLELTKI